MSLEGTPRLNALARAYTDFEFNGVEYILLEIGPEHYGFKDGDPVNTVWENAVDSLRELMALLGEGERYLQGLTNEEYAAAVDEWSNLGSR
jgi:hypothetical protein